MSDDGTVVGGDSGPVNSKFAMIWTEATGMVAVTDYLKMNGVTDYQSWDGLAQTVYIRFLDRRS